MNFIPAHTERDRWKGQLEGTPAPSDEKVASAFIQHLVVEISCSPGTVLGASCPKMRSPECLSLLTRAQAK